MSFRKIYEFSCYHGKISREEGLQILQTELENRQNLPEYDSLRDSCYLIRQLQNGGFSLLTKFAGIQIHIGDDEIYFDDAWKNNCLYKEPFKLCNGCTKISPIFTKRYFPSYRRNPLKLEELAKLKVSTINIDYESEVPQIFREEIKKLSEAKSFNVEENEIIFAFIDDKLCRLYNQK